MTMKPLSNHFKKHGTTFDLIKREGNCAMFTQKANSGSPRFVVCEVMQNEARFMAGFPIPATESIPSYNDWGSRAWTYLKRDDAEAKFKEFLVTLELRAAMKLEQSVNHNP